MKTFSICEPRLLDWDILPDEMARGLSHLRGLVFFDSVGNLPRDSGAAISVVAARPAEILAGDLGTAEGVKVLERGLEAGRVDGLRDFGFPTGGLCGWVDYEGGFVFGVYAEMLVFHHGTGEWWEVGELSKEWRELKEGAGDFWWGEWEDSLPREGFLRAVERVKEYIAAGDIYQVNLSRRLRARCEAAGGLLSVYEKLRHASPAPCAGYLRLAGREVLSSSPERFLRFSGREVETRPIKGTRPRFADPEADSRSAFDLQRSEKERAELVMITDLLRNDLGQVCEFGSVQVTQMLELERLEQVFHLVSTIRGTLAEEESVVSALAACFPGGSITGAPKKRAMEIIAELEPVRRGIYTGAMGYLGFNGESQFSIVIRTLVREGGFLDYQVGAGIVADSDPAAEFIETEDKARGVRLALESARRGEF